MVCRCHSVRGVAELNVGSEQHCGHAPATGLEKSNASKRGILSRLMGSAIFDVVRQPRHEFRIMCAGVRNSSHYHDDAAPAQAQAQAF